VISIQSVPCRVYATGEQKDAEAAGISGDDMPNSASSSSSGAGSFKVIIRASVEQHAYIGFAGRTEEKCGIGQPNNIEGGAIEKKQAAFRAFGACRQLLAAKLADIAHVRLLF